VEYRPQFPIRGCQIYRGIWSYCPVTLSSSGFTG
jgi:hypothetical protein